MDPTAPDSSYTPDRCRLYPSSMKQSSDHILERNTTSGSSEFVVKFHCTKPAPPSKNTSSTDAETN